MDLYFAVSGVAISQKTPEKSAGERSPSGNGPTRAPFPFESSVPRCTTSAVDGNQISYQLSVISKSNFLSVSETTGVAHPIELGTYDAPEGMMTLRVVAVEGVDKNRAGAGPFGLDGVVPMQPRAVPD